MEQWNSRKTQFNDRKAQDCEIFETVDIYNTGLCKLDYLDGFDLVIGSLQIGIYCRFVLTGCVKVCRVCRDTP